MQKDTQTEDGLASRLTQELEAFEPQSVYDAAMEMRYTKTGVTDTSKIEMVFGLNVYYALMSHRGINLLVLAKITTKHLRVLGLLWTART